MKKPVALSALTLLALFGFGCSPSQMIQEKITEKATESYINSKLGGDGSVDLSEGTVNFKGKDGSVSYGENVTVPADFPRDVAIYPKAKIIMASVNKDVSSLLAQSDDKKSAITDWYDMELLSGGWKKSSEEAAMGTWYRIYEKESRELTIAVSGDDSGSGTTITIGVNSK